MSVDDDSTHMFKRVLLDSVLRATTMTFKRRIFTTYNGLIGLSPAETKPGDVVVIVPSYSAPLVIRVDNMKAAKVPARVVGACYAHGVMEGEYMSNPDLSGPLDDVILY